MLRPRGRELPRTLCFSKPPHPVYALAACALYAGTNAFCTKSSYEVGVVFFPDRASSARMCPLFSASDISQSKARRLGSQENHAIGIFTPLFFANSIASG